MTAPAEANLPPPSAPESKGLEERRDNVHWEVTEKLADIAFEKFEKRHARTTCTDRYIHNFGFLAGIQVGLSQGREAGLRETSLLRQDLESVRREAKIFREVAEAKLSRMTEALEKITKFYTHGGTDSAMKKIAEKALK